MRTINKINPLQRSPLLLRLGIMEGILVLFCCVLFVSCADFKEVTFSGVDNVSITSLSQSGVEALITVRIKNPNNVSFTVYKSEMNVTIGGINAGKAYITDNVRIKAKCEEKYTFKVKSDFSGLSLADLPKIIAMGLSKRVKIGLKGNLKGGKFLFKRSYPIDLEENVPINGL